MATGTRQYIGARYVPLFGRQGEESIEWDNEAPYEPLTIVLHEGDSYTSRQFVPIGIAITNTQYWAKTGAYNAQIELLRQEVERQADVILDLSEDVVDLTNRVETAESDITSLGERVTNTESDITSLGERVTNTESDVEELTTKLNHNVPIANVKDYGAVGDGETDDTQAFQDALETGKDVLIPASNNESYLITDTLNCSTARQVIYSDVNKHSDSLIKFTPQNETHILFNMTRLTNFVNIAVNISNQDDYYNGIAFNCTSSVSPNETGGYFYNCWIYHFNIGINYVGRNLEIINSQMASCNKCINISWVDDPDSPPAKGNSSGYRSFRILNNKFHAVKTAAIYLNGATTTTTNTIVLKGILISGNMMDKGDLCFIRADVALDHANISNNYIVGTGSTAILRFLENVTNSTIVGNTMFCNSDLGHVEYGIYITKQFISTSISGNSFFGMTNCVLRFNDTFENSIFSNNSLEADSENTVIAIKAYADINKSIISNNTFNKFKTAIQNYNSPDYLSAKIIGNSGAFSVGFIEGTKTTDSNTSIEYNIS